MHSASSDLKTNHVSTSSSRHFAALYRDRKLTGGHVIMLGPSNEEAAHQALDEWPGGLQVGGGINDKNAAEWVAAGAEKVSGCSEAILWPMTDHESRRQVIVTSFLFPDGAFSQDRLGSCLEALNNDKRRLVLDLSCRKKGSTWFVAMNKWQTLTDFEITTGTARSDRKQRAFTADVGTENLKKLEGYCSEFLVHAADNEGLQQGIDERLVQKMGEHCSIPVTYAGGARHLDDLERVKSLSKGRVDVTIGSALDIFGGSLVSFEDCVAWNMKQEEAV